VDADLDVAQATLLQDAARIGCRPDLTRFHSPSR
jgi:hypothetical protein